MFLPIWRYISVTLNTMMYESQDDPYCNEYCGCPGCNCRIYGDYFSYLKYIFI